MVLAKAALLGIMGERQLRTLWESDLQYVLGHF